MKKLHAVTLIETLITLLAISFMISGPIFFVSRSFAYARFVQNKIVATSLAQEGLELATSLRNSATSTFATAMDSTCLPTGCAIDWNGTSNEPVVRQCNTSDTSCRLLLVDNTYRHTAGGDPSQYLRALIVEKNDSMHSYAITSRVWSDEDTAFKTDVSLKKILYAN